MRPRGVAIVDEAALGDDGSIASASERDMSGAPQSDAMDVDASVSETDGKGVPPPVCLMTARSRGPLASR